MNAEKVLVGLVLTVLAVVLSYRLTHDRPAHVPPPFEPAPPAARQTLIYFGTKWCPACRRLENTLAEPRVAALLQAAYTVTRYDGDRDREMARQYGASAWPTVILLGPDGRERRRFVGYRSPADLLAWLGGPEGVAAELDRVQCLRDDRHPATPARRKLAEQTSALRGFVAGEAEWPGFSAVAGRDGRDGEPGRSTSPARSRSVQSAPS